MHESCSSLCLVTLLCVMDSCRHGSLCVLCYKVPAACNPIPHNMLAQHGTISQGVSVELFCSPEIIRQGELEAWDGSGSVWLHGHCVLTRAGFLHWFKSADDTVPADTLNLARWVCALLKMPVLALRLCTNADERMGM